MLVRSYTGNLSWLDHAIVPNAGNVMHWYPELVRSCTGTPKVDKIMHWYTELVILCTDTWGGEDHALVPGGCNIMHWYTELINSCNCS